MVVVSFSCFTLIGSLFLGLSFVASAPVVNQPAKPAGSSHDHVALSTPPAPHFVIYSDQGTGSLGPPAPSAVNV